MRQHRLDFVRWIGLSLACAVASATAAESASHWIERMNQALTRRNYDGIFTHWQGGRVEMLRIIHRVQDGATSERLVSLDGSGREFIRTGGSLTCYLPDRRTVLVERRPRGERLLGGFPAIDPQTASFYDIQEVARTRFNRRDTHVITVAPRDQFRYGYRLWIDDDSAMPLKTQLCDAHGHVIEQIVFAELALPERIPDTAFHPDVSTEGFQWLRDEAAPPAGADGPAPLVWSADKLPPGFRMTAHAAQTLPGASSPVDHIVFTDGLASVSVFVETHTARPGEDAGTTEAARVGSSSAFSTVVDGHKVTAVGEVPPATVRSIANAVRAAQGGDRAGDAPMPAPAFGPRH